jgi:hypothetical protein
MSVISKFFTHFTGLDVTIHKYRILLAGPIARGTFSLIRILEWKWEDGNKYIVTLPMINSYSASG